MAKKKNTASVDSVLSPKVGLCIECIHGYVMSDGKPRNPLITECSINHIRYSQSSLCCIGQYEKRKDESKIHPMIYLK